MEILGILSMFAIFGLYILVCSLRKEESYAVETVDGGSYSMRGEEISAAQMQMQENPESSGENPDDSSSSEPNSEISEEDKPIVEKTANAVIEELQKLGCPIQRLDLDCIDTLFQGERLRFQIGLGFVRVWDPWWKEFDASEDDREMILEVINRINGDSSVSLILSNVNDNGKFALTSKIDSIFDPNVMSDLSLAMEYMVKSLLFAKSNFYRVYHEFKASRPQIIVTPKSETPENPATPDVQDTPNSDNPDTPNTDTPDINEN